jgi:hypothetical protein
MRTGTKALLLCLTLWEPTLIAQGAGPSRPFSIHDTDRDGYLSPEEYRVLLELRRERHAQRRRALAPQPAPAFDEVDRDGDGRITETELLAMLQHHMYRYQRRGPPWR